MFSVLYQVHELLQKLLKAEGISVIAANSFVKDPENVITDLKVSKVRGWIGTSVFKPSYISHDSPVILKLHCKFSQTSFLLIIHHCNLISVSKSISRRLNLSRYGHGQFWQGVGSLKKYLKARFDFWKRVVNVKEQIQGG